MQNTVAKPVALTDCQLSATFVVGPCGAVTAPSDSLLQLLGYPAPPTPSSSPTPSLAPSPPVCASAVAPQALWPLSTLLADAQQAQQLLLWLNACTGPSALVLPTALLCHSGEALALTLFVSAHPAGVAMQAFCAVRPQDLAQQQQSESELRLRYATEASGQGVWDWNVCTGAVNYSPLWMRLLGHAEHEFAGHYDEWHQRLHPDDTERAVAILTECLQGGSSGFYSEYRLRHKDGTYAWMLSRGAVVERAADGRPLRMIGTLCNINQRVQARIQLEQSEERLHAITENTRTVMFMKDLQGRYLYVNRRFEEVFQVPKERVLGKTAQFVFGSVMAHSYQTHDQWVLSTGHTLEVDESALHADGSLHTYVSVKVPVRDAQGTIYAICAIETDVTDAKRMENQMRVAAVAFETPISMMITDGNKVIQQVNQAFVQISGFSAEYAVGRTPDFLISGKHSPAFYRSLWQTIDEQGTWQGEIWARRSDQSLYLSWLMISSVKDVAGRVSHYVAAEMDISERKRAEAALHTLNRELQKKKAQLRELVANNEAVRESERKHMAREVHDELGQTLTALRMGTSFIAMRFGEQDPALLDKVLGMRLLVDKAIHSVRAVASSLRPVALDMGLYLALDWLCKDFARHSGVACVLHSLVPHMELDEARSVVVFRIVQESLSNIGRYALAQQVYVSFGVSGQQLGVEILDDGVGFDPLRESPTKTFGLLGMKERALALGGHLDIISAAGQGTCIGLSIPRHRPDAEGAP